MAWSSQYPFQSPTLPFNTFQNVAPYGSIVGTLSNGQSFAGMAGNLIQYQLLWYDANPSILTGIQISTFTPDPIPFRIPVVSPTFAYNSLTLDPAGNFVGLNTLDTSKMFASAVGLSQAIIGGHAISDGGGVNPTPGNSDDSGVLLAVEALNIAAGATVSWYLPVYNRQVSLRVSSSSVAEITMAWGPPLGQTGCALQQTKPAGTTHLYLPEIYMPSNQARFSIRNSGGAVGSYYATIIALDNN